MATKKSSKNVSRKTTDQEKIQILLAEIDSMRSKIVSLYGLASISQQNDMKLLQLIMQQQQASIVKTAWPKLGSLGKREEFN